jgi:hypothetical protein
MRRLVVCVLAILCATGCASAEVAARPQVASPVRAVSNTPSSSARTDGPIDCGRWTPTSAELTAVREIAATVASNNVPPGVPRASWIACTRGGYLALSGEGRLGDQAAADADVIVVVIRGRFKVGDHSMPPPTGADITNLSPRTVNTMDFDYDPAMGRGLDGGTGLSEADINRIGSFKPLSLS